MQGWVSSIRFVGDVNTQILRSTPKASQSIWNTNSGKNYWSYAVGVLL
jgi:hypothetical protein